MKKIEIELFKAWREWHSDTEDLPNNGPNESFIKGYKMGWENRHDLLILVGGALYRLDKYGYINNGISTLDDKEQEEAEHWINVGLEALKKR